MRISNRNLIMNQLRNMSTTLGNFTNSNNRMTSGRKFDHAYENVADATRAMRLRKSIRDKEFYITNIRDARGRLNSAEDAIQTTVNILRSVTDRVEEALNGTVPDEDRKKIATEISNLQEEVLSLMNTTYTDHPVFSGSGYDKKNVAPFATQGNKLLYHGMNVDQLYYNKETGTYQKPHYEDIFVKDASGNDIPVYEVETDKDGKPIFEYAKDKSGNVVYDPATVNGKKVYYTNSKTDPTAMGVTTPITDLTVTEVYDEDGNLINDLTTIEYNPQRVKATQVDGKYPRMPVAGADGNVYKDPTKIPAGTTVYNLVYTKQATLTTYEDMDYISQNYLDIGVGHTFKQNEDGTFSINPETVHQFTYSGVEVFGAGKTNGHANNVYTFLGEIVDSMNNNNMDLLGEQLNHIKDVQENLLTSITEIGVRTNFLDNMEDIHKNDLLNFQTRQKDVEAVDLPQEAMNNKNHEMAWMVTLQMGSKILPSSLFDFLR